MGATQMPGPKIKSGPAAATTKDRPSAPSLKKKTATSASKTDETTSSAAAAKLPLRTELANVDIIHRDGAVPIALRASTARQAAADRASAAFANGKLTGWLPPSALSFSGEPQWSGRGKAERWHGDGVQQRPARPARNRKGGKKPNTRTSSLSGLGCMLLFLSGHRFLEDATGQAASPSDVQAPSKPVRFVTYTPPSNAPTVKPKVKPLAAAAEDPTTIASHSAAERPTKANRGQKRKSDERGAPTRGGASKRDLTGVPAVVATPRAGRSSTATDTARDTSEGRQEARLSPSSAPVVAVQARKQTKTKPKAAAASAPTVSLGVRDTDPALAHPIVQNATPPPVLPSSTPMPALNPTPAPAPAPASGPAIAADAPRPAGVPADSDSDSDPLASASLDWLDALLAHADALLAQATATPDSSYPPQPWRASAMR
ncbi:uncharacterized protein PHACADRAFT_187785 [Phanerochaete carnosa HHB-10118-sp]|uniref:Uncharacterized protein n=1 Tax=Phanerochaete carnosa (strain HHB-10118-sp) TaxID=650164 RepID=K5VIV4_PHACS|nr:uncharacterized protein PHACADRAFT_187785 [Phanerochaete carnosa HHB-10118-sp]EKM51223.1 hypothetical protein PHACADRAFT_187785 [Phanerochaete carnosa HHB-10118-sp]